MGLVIWNYKWDLVLEFEYPIEYLKMGFGMIRVTVIKIPNKQRKSKIFTWLTVKKNNMKNKNRDLDSYYTKLRAPFEHVFLKQNKRVRYKGIAKNQFSAFMQAITFNLKRLTVLTASPPLLST